MKMYTVSFTRERLESVYRHNSPHLWGNGETYDVVVLAEWAADAKVAAFNAVEDIVDDELEMKSWHMVYKPRECLRRMYGDCEFDRGRRLGELNPEIADSVTAAVANLDRLIEDKVEERFRRERHKDERPTLAEKARWGLSDENKPRRGLWSRI